MKHKLILLSLSLLPYLAMSQVAKDTVTVLSPAQITAASPNDTANIYFVINNAWRKANFDSIARYTRVRFQTLTLDSTHIAASGLNLQGSRFTGTLPVGKGGTAMTTLGAANRIPFAASATAMTTDTGLVWNSTSKSLGVNTSNPGARLEVQSFTSGSVAMLLRNNVERTANTSAYTYVLESEGKTGSSYAFRARNLNESKIYFTIQTDSLNQVNGERQGFVGINTDAPTQFLDVNGNARIRTVGTASASNSALYITDTGVLSTNSSDVDKKHNIRALPYGLSTINNLNPVAFNWNDDDSEDIGFVAQDISQHIPETVISNWNGDLIFRQEKIIPVLVKAIQEQQAQIEQLKQRIIQLENK